MSSCTWYTPDFIIGNRLVVEVDGGIHDLEYRKTPDRIRQRALENMGYSVYRVRNKQVESSPFDVAGKIIDRYYQIMEFEAAPNFIKNLVFYGGPRAKPGVISVKDADTLESNIDSFNRNFSKVGITVEKNDVVIECREELEKMKRRMKYDRISSYGWLSQWLNLS